MGDPATIGTPPIAILIVEDERLVAMDLQQSLRRLGYDAFAIAASADEALARAAERTPDVVLMDIRIRGTVDGIDAAHLLRARLGAALIYLTAHADDATLVRAKATAPVGYLVKPIRTADLRSTIEVGYLRHVADARLRERERWISTVLRSVADGVVAVDERAQVAFINPAAAALVGQAEADALGQPVGRVLRLVPPAPNGGAEVDPLAVALDQRRPASAGEALVPHPTGASRLVRAAAAPVLDADRLLGAVVTLHDLTERRQAERRLAATERLASIGTLAAGVAHELNTPLAAVLLNATFVRDVLQAPAPPAGDTASDRAAQLADADEALADIGAAVDRMATIVADLRTFARDPADGAGVADVARAVAWAVRMTAHRLAAHARVVTDVGRMPAAAVAEPRLGEVLLHLLVNAGQAIAPGRPDAHEIAVRATTTATGDVVIEVRDTGHGMPPEVMARVFEPFFTTRPVGEGIGLGLAVSHGIVVAAGGTIDVSSRPGAGATFRVTLPAAGAPAPALAAEHAVAPPSARVPAAARPRLLLVDDHAAVLQSLQRLLRASFDVTAVDDARDALATIAAGARFDAILCDLTMPVMSGRELHRALVAAAPDLADRMIFLSGGAIDPEDLAYLAASGRPQLPKPITLDALRAAIAGVTGS